MLLLYKQLVMEIKTIKGTTNNTLQTSLRESGVTSILSSSFVGRNLFISQPERFQSMVPIKPLGKMVSHDLSYGSLPIHWWVFL